MRPGNTRQREGRQAGAVVGAGHEVKQPRGAPAAAEATQSSSTHFVLARAGRRAEGEMMQSVELPGTDRILKKISSLLATAWERRARLRLMAPVSEAQPSTNAVDKTAPQSPPTSVWRPARMAADCPERLPSSRAPLVENHVD